MRTFIRVMACMVLLLLFMGCANAEYPMFHHDTQRTGYVPGAGPGTEALRWSAPLGEFIGAPPVVENGRVYVGVWPDMNFVPGEQYNFSCLDTTSGAVVWSTPLGSGMGTVSGAAIAGDQVFVGCMDGRLYCLDKQNGAKRWSVPVDLGNADGNWYGLASSPVVDNGTVYVTSLTDGTLHAFTLDGREAWTYRTGSQTFAYSSPAIDRGRVFFAGSTGSNALYCIDATTHAKVWQANVTGEIKSTPVISGATVVITTTDTLVAVNRETGSIRWTKPISASWGTPAVAGDAVYLGTRADATLHCYDMAAGNERWKFVTNGKIDTSPIVTDNAVYFASNTATGTIYAVDLSGHELWHRATTNYVMSPPAVSDGSLFIGSDEGTLYAFGPTPKLVPGGVGGPRDLNGDGLYEDVNGNGRRDFADVVLFFNRMSWVASNEPLEAFDFNRNGRLDFADVVRLFNSL
jgi:outer membrane protein assembly factor BamB